VLKYLGIGLAVLVLVVVAAAAGYLNMAADRVVVTDDMDITVPRGATMRGLAADFTQKGIIDEPWSMRILARYMGLSSSLRAGEYRVAAGTTLTGLLTHLTSGDVIDYPITIIEGWTFSQMRDALKSQAKLRQLTADMDDAELMKKISGTDVHYEGRFFPDTYHFTADMSDLDVLKRAYDRMSRVLARQWENRAEDLPIKTADEALILASIIEKETGAVEERAQIAGVFVNRLRKGMRLQTDPTVIYGMGDEYKGNIRRKDLRKDTPYNTYTRHGLPPTPIALPGGDAIHAALHPAETKALYFVSRGDGTHVFSNTLKEHNEAVIQYQLKGKRKNFSSYNDKAASKEKD
jgi:UPF0755 protein